MPRNNGAPQSHWERVRKNSGDAMYAKWNVCSAVSSTGLRNCIGGIAYFRRNMFPTYGAHPTRAQCWARQCCRLASEKLRNCVHSMYLPSGEHEAGRKRNKGLLNLVTPIRRSSA